jgi:formamidopyrimidine-DNA glycosylase
VLGDLGPEPLSDEFTPSVFAEILGARRGALKPLLLNQRVVAGLGNIYVDEALFGAGLHPRRRANSLAHTEVQRLHAAIRAVLLEAIRSRGTTLDDESFHDAEGQPGNNADNLRVYQRTGEPCRQCGAIIERGVVGGRGTHICPVCQSAAKVNCV